MTSAPAQSPETLVAVMLYPERDKPQRNSPYRFPTPKASGKANAKVEMAMDGEFLAAGPNFLTTEVYEHMCQNPFWERCLKKRVLEVIVQQPESKATGTTADFDLTDAFTLIEGSVDIEWLKRCLVKDDRSDIQTWASEKIKEIQDAAMRE
jgi:hypothetical protein